MKLMTASALAMTIAASGAYAQDASNEDTAGAGMATQGEMIRSRDITGGPVYTTNEADDEGWDSANVYDAVGTDWNQIGEIEDLVLSQDGQLVGIVAEVGGFLDLGDKHVVIELDDVNLVAADEYSFVTRLNEEDLESMEGVDEGFWQ